MSSERPAGLLSASTGEAMEGVGPHCPKDGVWWGHGHGSNKENQINKCLVTLSANL